MKQIIDDFHKLYYSKDIISNTFWNGVRIGKPPSDLWTYQELIYNTRPSLIIECGTNYGGSSLFFANLFDIFGYGQSRRIITIDIADRVSKRHPRVSYLIGSSTSKEIFKSVTDQIKVDDCIMVVLDSAHEKDHVLKEMEMYSPLVTIGLYMVVEDGNMHGHPVLPTHPEGPLEAIEEFFKTHDNFQIDKSYEEKFLMSFNPSGYLKRIN